MVIIYLYGPPDFNNSHICYQDYHSELSNVVKILVGGHCLLKSYKQKMSNE